MKKLIILFCLLLLISPAISFAKARTDTISIRNLKSGLRLDHFWKYKIGDERAWAFTDFDDNDWHFVEADSTRDTLLKNFQGIAWFRASFVIDSTISGIPLALKMRTNGACEIFIDGKLIHSLGIVGKTEKDEVSGFSLRTNIIPVPVFAKGRHQLSVRASCYYTLKGLGNLRISPGLTISDFNAEILSMQKALNEEQDISEMTIPMFFSGAFIVLSIFHLVLFLYYRKSRSNLYYSLFTFLLFLIFFGFYSSLAGTDLQGTLKIFFIEMLSLLLVPLFFIGILYEVFYKKLLKMFWILCGLLVTALVSILILDWSSFGAVLLFIFLVGGFIETIRVFIRAWVKKREGSRIFIFGIFFPVIGVIAIAIISSILEKTGLKEVGEKLSDHSGEFFIYSMLMSVSISMTIYLARDFARINKKLNQQIKEIKQLFDRTISQEAERKRILENQNVELERMVTLRTEEVVRQKSEIELKNRDILDNLLYARRIQEAILPEIRLIYQTLRDSFIIYWPKDIVSGDFYSFSQRDGKVIIAAADCTGHGVTGAFMSMIGSSVLNEIINQRGIIQPSLVLNNLNIGITEALKQRETEVNDGMDIALCTLDLKTLFLQFAGANRPLYLFRKGEFMEIKPDKLAIGGFRLNRDLTFSNHEVQLQPGDALYIFSDGFADQFGGPHGKKLLSKRFREILLSIQHLSMKEQEKHLTDFFTEWKGDLTQVDDVLVIGIRI